MLKHTIRAIVLAVAAMPSAYAQQLMACDLVDPAAASRVLGSEVTRHLPSRTIQKLEGGVLTSKCLFYARKDRDSLWVTLFEYPSVKEAEKAFAEGTANTEDVKHTRVSGFGERAAWWSLGTEGHGLKMSKGRRVLVLDTRWRDASTGAGLKERLTPVAAAAAKKL